MDNPKEYINRYDTVISFVALEIMALTAFGLGGATGLVILRILGFFISLAIIPFIRANHSNEELKGYLFGLIPIIVFVVFGSFSAFWVSIYSSVFSGIVNDLTVFLGFAGFFILGYGIKQIKTLKMDWVILALLSGLGLLTLITTSYTLARYGFFYVQRFSEMVYYYDGILFRVDQETKVLDGFTFRESSLTYGMVSPFLLACALPACLFVSPKKDQKRFCLILVFGLLGLFALVVLPYVRALIILLVIFVLAAIYRFAIPKHQKVCSKPWTIIGYVGMGLVVFGLLVLFLDSFLSTSFLAKIPFFGKYFSDTAFAGKFETAIRITFFSSGSRGTGSFDLLSVLFGNQVDSSGLIKGQNYGSWITRSMEFNVLWQNGFIAFAALVALIFACFTWGRRYLASGEGEMSNKVIPVLMMLGYFLYISIGEDEVPFNHYVAFAPAERTSQFTLMFFLIGLIYTPVSVAPKKAKEPVEKKNKKAVAHE